MKIATIIARILLGLVFTVFGSNAFLHFIPMPPMSGPSGDFITAMYTTHYLYVVAALALFLLWRYRANFAGLLKP
jgi:putative oxidoreductase